MIISITSILEGASAANGAISLLRFLYRQGKKVVNWVRAKKHPNNSAFLGCWDNQGQISNPPTHYIDLTLNNYGLDIEGRFNVRSSHDPNSWEMFSLRGVAKSKAFACEVYRQKTNELAAYGYIKMIDGRLIWMLHYTQSNQFPRIAILNRGLPTIA